jgi:tetratricopeptide (TPR) repeat protein
LANALATVGEYQRALEYARLGTEIARRISDQRLLPLCLLGIVFALQAPEHAEQRLIYATEFLDAAKAGNSEEFVLYALWWHAHSALEVGDIAAAHQDISEHRGCSEELRAPFALYSTINLEVCEASIHGRFADCERLAQESLAIGQGFGTESVAGVFGAQMFTLRREQGGLRELEPLLRRFLQNPANGRAWRPGLALIYAELGRAEEARTEFEGLAANNFSDILRDANWLVSLVYLADVCMFLEDSGRAPLLYELLLPYQHNNVLIASGSACYGAASRYLGALAATLARWNEAERHFQDALAMNRRMGARPWLAHTEYQYARMLLSRDRPGDSDKAGSLLKDALNTARELGMLSLEQRITNGSP